MNEVGALADEKSTAYWKAGRTLFRGWLFSLNGKAADAVEMTSGLAAMRPTGGTAFIPARLSDLARAYADLNRFDDAWHSIDEAMAVIETTKEKWWEAEVNRPGVNCGRCYRA